MSSSFIPFIFTLLVLVTLSSVPVSADVTLYSTNFSDTTGWETNSPASFYLDEKSERYHYLIAGITGSYASYPLAESFTGPFTLEFDVYPIKTDEKSSFRFGLGNENTDSQKGPLVIAELNNQNGDQAFSLTAISKESLRSQTFSIPGKASYSGKTVKFSDGEEYHVRMTWYPVEKRVSVTVTTPGEDTPLFSHFVMVTGKMEDFTHLFLTSIGEGQNDRKAEGFIDNIILTSPDSAPGVIEPTSTPAEKTPVPVLAASITHLLAKTDLQTGVTSEPETFRPTQMRTPLPNPPTPIPTEKAGFFSFGVIIGTLAVLILHRR